MTVTACKFAVGSDIASLTASINALIAEDFQPAAGVAPVQIGSVIVQRMDEVEDDAGGE